MALVGHDLDRPAEAEWPAWSGSIYRAWQALRDDRHYGAMGGLGRIYFTAKDRYAERYGIEGDEFDDFLMFIDAMDEEYVAVSNEKQKAESEKTEAKGKT